MIWITAIIVGIVVGYVALVGVSSERRMNAWYAVFLGIIGGLLGAWFFFFVLGLMTSSAAANFWLSILWSIIGAVVLLTIIDSISYVASKQGEMQGRKRAGRVYPHEYEQRKRTTKKK